MRTVRVGRVVLVALSLSACVSTAPFQVRSPRGRDPDRAGDRRWTGMGGPAVIVGEAGSANFYASPRPFRTGGGADRRLERDQQKRRLSPATRTANLGTFDTAMFPGRRSTASTCRSSRPEAHRPGQTTQDETAACRSSCRIRRVEFHRRLVACSSPRTERHGVVSSMLRTDAYNMFRLVLRERRAVVAQLSSLAE